MFIEFTASSSFSGPLYPDPPISKILFSATKAAWPLTAKE